MNPSKSVKTMSQTLEHIDLGHVDINVGGTEKVEVVELEDAKSEESRHEGEIKSSVPLSTARDLVTEILAVEDDPTLVKPLSSKQ
jgi:hypothetical protein